MKRSIIQLSALLLVSLPGCELGLLQSGKSTDSKEAKGYQQSYEKWLSDKAAHKDSYQYIVTFSSWAGFGENTTLTVNRGVVTGRKYEAWKQKADKPGEKEITMQWTESASDLNSHQEGAAAQTLEQVYQQCSTNWLGVDTSRNTVYFEHENNGLLSLCGYVPKDCADDCFTGVRVAELSWLE